MRAPMRTILLATLLATGCVKQSTYDKAMADNHQLHTDLDAANTHAKTLDDQIKQLQDQLSQLDTATKSKEDELGKVRGEKDASEKELADLRRQKEATEKRLAQYKAMQDKFRALVDTGKLQVAFRNGQMTLKLPSGILFPSGSADLSKGGEQAITDVTNILMQFQDRRFVVAGHTDNQPIRTVQFKNNWYLSTARANSVVQFMIKAGFPAKNLAAAGYAEFDPVAPNDTEPSREQNRRIEIILVPNLEELPTLTDAQP
jgi:chemotaxis protein MotB